MCNRSNKERRTPHTGMSQLLTTHVTDAIIHHLFSQGVLHYAGLVTCNRSFTLMHAG